jgi:hypothetical protein
LKSHYALTTCTWTYSLYMAISTFVSSKCENLRDFLRKILSRSCRPIFSGSTSGNSPPPPIVQLQNNNKYFISIFLYYYLFFIPNHCTLIIINVSLLFTHAILILLTYKFSIMDVKMTFKFWIKLDVVCIQLIWIYNVWNNKKRPIHYT